MKIDKKLIKELVENLKEFNLSELEYQDGQTKIKVSKSIKTLDTSKTGAVVSPNKTVLKLVTKLTALELNLQLLERHI